MSSKTRDGSPKPTLKDLLESSDVNLFNAADKKTQELYFLYRKWERSARANCGTRFVHQAYKSPSQLRQELNSPTAM